MSGQAAQRPAEGPAPYRTVLDHLAQELDRLDLLIGRRVASLRHHWAAAEDGKGTHPHLFVSNEEVDWLLCRGDSGPMGPGAGSVGDSISVLDGHIARAVNETLAAGAVLPLERLAGLFNLTPIERQALIICLAPELRSKYDRLYAFLQNDITRKKPSVDLILDLCCETEFERWQCRALFDEGGTLFRARLLQATTDAQSPSGSSGLAQCLKLDPCVLSYLLGQHGLDDRLSHVVRLRDPGQAVLPDTVDETARDSLFRATDRHFANASKTEKPLFVHLHGPRGVGRRDLALADCRRLGCLLLELDLERLMADEAQGTDLLKLAFRQSLLLQAPLFFRNSGALDSDGNRFFRRCLGKTVEEFGWLTYAAGDKPWQAPELARAAAFYSIALPMPDEDAREAVWRRAAEAIWPEAGRVATAPLAHRFRLTQGQILDAVEHAKRRHALEGDNRPPTTQDLAAACRAQSNQRLGAVATKVTPRYGWDDIVLPQDTAEILKEICSQARHRHTVMTQWGFEGMLAHGTGLAVLFSGPPGTGKTMAAQVIARDLQVDLYKVDLASVVSKFIGETEKNLSRIFAEAETSNAVLFFDEADALFGKRTEVSDAHDRYANIEVSYLLQRMEEHSGIVILATNFQNNMDEAFVRRIRFIVDFPFPNEASRREIWKVHFPDRAPVSKHIDFDFLAREISVAGGSIKNIVLNAAFRAAETGGEIGMPHIVQSTRREFAKIGKLWREETFARHGLDKVEEARP